MCYEEIDSNYKKEDLAKIIRNCNTRLLADFTEHYGLSTLKDMYHYLLKYTYVDNWELELLENYFSFNYDELFAMGDIIYKKNYTLEYKKQMVKKDFGIDLVNHTHIQLIIKIK